MPTPATPELDREAWELAQQHSTITEAAKAAGVNRCTFDSRVKRHERRLEKGQALTPEGVALVNAAGADVLDARMAWLKTESVSVRVDFPQTNDVIDTIRTAMSEVPPAPDVPAPRHKAPDLAVIYPVADLHAGLKSWGRETGADYDTTTAVERLVSWVGGAVSNAPPAETAVILAAGDTFHADDETSQTPKSKHSLDVDNRHFRTMGMVVQAFCSVIEHARKRHKRVVVRILPGNHDPHASIALLFAVHMRYIETPGVEVQTDPSEHFVWRFGRCLVAAHHGHRAKPDKLVAGLAAAEPVLWGETEHRYLFTGHLHHIAQKEYPGCIWEQLSAMTNADAHAAAWRYVARPAFQAIVLHQDKGEVARFKVCA